MSSVKIYTGASQKTASAQAAVSAAQFMPDAAFCFVFTPLFDTVSVNAANSCVRSVRTIAETVFGDGCFERIKEAFSFCRAQKDEPTGDTNRPWSGFPVFKPIDKFFYPNMSVLPVDKSAENDAAYLNVIAGADIAVRELLRQNPNCFVYIFIIGIHESYGTVCESSVNRLAKEFNAESGALSGRGEIVCAQIATAGYDKLRLPKFNFEKDVDCVALAQLFGQHSVINPH